MRSHFALLWIWLPQVVSRLSDVDARVTKQILDCSQHQGKNKLATTPQLNITEHFLAHRMGKKSLVLLVLYCYSSAAVELELKFLLCGSRFLCAYIMPKWAVKKQLSDSSKQQITAWIYVARCIHSICECYMWIKHFSAWSRVQFLWAVNGACREGLVHWPLIAIYGEDIKVAKKCEYMTSWAKDELPLQTTTISFVGQSHVWLFKVLKPNNDSLLFGWHRVTCTITSNGFALF